MATTPVGRWSRSPLLALVIAAWLGSPAAPAQELSEADLVQALQEGGLVLVISNAHSPQEPPEEGDRAPANLNGEREIDEHGQGQMSVLAYALRELDVPVSLSLSSPAYRSRQSASYLGFGKQMVVDTLAEGAPPSGLTERIAEPPPSGENTVIITHASLISAALGADAGDSVGPAETWIYRPNDAQVDPGAELVARLTVEDWAKLAVD